MNESGAAFPTGCGTPSGRVQGDWLAAQKRARVSFSCPQCGGRSLDITAVLEVEGDCESDEITVQLLACCNCPLRAAGAYEESRRGALDSECYRHYAYTLPQATWQELQRVVQDCPAPDQSQCSCQAHRSLGLTDARGRWSGLDLVSRGDWFALS